MTTLVHAALTFRRSARVYWGFFAAAIFGLLDLLGAYMREVPSGPLKPEHGFVALAFLVVIALRGGARLRHEEEGERLALLDVELGLLLLTGVHAVVQLFGGLTSEIYPVVYVAVAFVAAFSVKPTGTILTLVALGFEAALYFLTESRTEVRPFALHAGFILFFGFLNVLFTRAEIARVRELSRRERDEEKEKVREDARLFRLLAAPSESTDRTESDEERLFRSSLEEVHNQLYHALELLHASLSLHTCVLLFANEDGSSLRIVERVTASEDVADGPFSAGEGVVGAVIKRGSRMALEHIRPGYKGICYYRGPALVRSFIGVPVAEGGQLRGVLCADRLEDEPFSAREEELMGTAVSQVLRALQNERLFVQLERSKREQTVLYRASQALGAALDEDAVLDAGLRAATEIAQHDFAAVSLYDGRSRKHSIRRAVGDGAEAFQDLTFKDNTSLTAMAVKNRHYLPYRGDFDEKQQTVYTKRANLRGMESLLILPLIVREDAFGALALAARRPEAFGDSVRATLQVLANQFAVALANARSVRRLEEMATTDGLTGCLNKRAFLDELESKLRSAERFKRPLSLIVTDIDHFKSVNDTYGHATGDVVIRELGEILKRVKRETDVVARFGGEEFCVLCEETEADGALLLAERVREELSQTVFQTEIGKLSVTASLGVATYPKNAKAASHLFEVADQALYAAKHAGRDRVCSA